MQCFEEHDGEAVGPQQDFPLSSSPSKARLAGIRASLLDATLDFEGATSSCGYCQPSAHHGFLGSCDSQSPKVLACLRANPEAYSRVNLISPGKGRVGFPRAHRPLAT